MRTRLEPCRRVGLRTDESALGWRRKPFCLILMLSGILPIFVFVSFEAKSVDDSSIAGLELLVVLLLQPPQLWE